MRTVWTSTRCSKLKSENCTAYVCEDKLHSFDSPAQLKMHNLADTRDMMMMRGTLDGPQWWVKLKLHCAVCTFNQQFVSLILTLSLLVCRMWICKKFITSCFSHHLDCNVSSLELVCSRSAKKRILSTQKLSHSQKKRNQKFELLFDSH